MTPSAGLLSSKWARWVGVLVATGLLLASIAMVITRRDAVDDAIAALRSPSPSLAAALFGAVSANLILTGVLFSILIRRYGRVGLLEMQAVIAAASLMNFLPLRPGILGRVAYHKAVNNINATDSARVVIQGAILSSAVAGYLALAVVVISRVGESAALTLWELVLGPLVILPVGGWLMRRGSLQRTLAFGATIRYLEVLAWSARYAAAFALIGSPIPPHAAVAFACISTIATMVPFSSNGLGLREWAIGAAAPLLTPYQLELGITAELVNRAAELVVLAIAGLAGSGYLMLKRRAPVTK